MSCHNIGHGLNEVVRKVLEEFDAGLIPYESAFRILQQCAKSVYWCDGNEYEAAAGVCEKGYLCFDWGFYTMTGRFWNWSKKKLWIIIYVRTALTS